MVGGATESTSQESIDQHNIIPSVFASIDQHNIIPSVFASIDQHIKPTISNNIAIIKRPTIEELDILFPIYERTHTYTYEELLKLYDDLSKPLEIIDPVQELKNYIKYLEKNQLKKGGNCDDFVDGIKLLKETEGEFVFYKPKESYKNENMQKLKQLGEYNIYGMQDPEQYVSFAVVDCEKMYKFLQFLINKGIKHIVCLHPCGESMQKLCSIDDSIQFHYKPIVDFERVSFEIGMSIIALIELIGDEPIVFYCKAGCGRTGSILYMISMYFKCILDHSKLLNPLPIITSVSPRHPINSFDDAVPEWFADEYSQISYNELFINSTPKLLAERINIIYRIIAESLVIYHSSSTSEELQYRQYYSLSDRDSINDYNFFNNQLVYNAISPCKEEKERIIELAFIAIPMRPNLNIKIKLSFILIPITIFEENLENYLPIRELSLNLSFINDTAILCSLYMSKSDNTQYAIVFNTQFHNTSTIPNLTNLEDVTTLPTELIEFSSFANFIKNLKLLTNNINHLQKILVFYYKINNYHIQYLKDNSLLYRDFDRSSYVDNMLTFETELSSI
jgi:protein tyrosine phosphatase